jgi:hypothetical protein
MALFGGKPKATEPEPAPVVETPKPDPVPAGPDPRDEKISALELNVHRLSTQLESLNGMLGQVVGRGAPQQQIPAPVIEDVSDEEIETAVGEGKGLAPRVRKMLNAFEARLVQNYINPLKETGLGAVAGLSQEVAKGQMPHYGRFKQEIDQYVTGLPAEARLNPQVYVVAHNAVVGAHMSELLEEERQKTIRQANQTTAQEPTASVKTPSKDAQKAPSAADLGGDDAAAALQVIGKDEDAFAKRLGYKDWQDYMAKTEEYAQ